MIKIPLEIKEKLTQLGFSRNEIYILIAVFSGNNHTVLELAEKTGIPRASVHVAIESLISQNLVVESSIGKKRFINSRGIESLTDFLESKEHKLAVEKKLIEELTSPLRELVGEVYKNEQAIVTTNQGEEGFLEVYLRIIKESKKGEINRLSVSFSDFSKVGIQKLDEISELRKKHNAHLNLFLPNSEINNPHYSTIKNTVHKRSVYILPEVIQPEAIITQWNSCVSFTVWDNGYNTITIENSKIAKTISDMFTHIKNTSTQR